MQSFPSTPSSPSRVLLVEPTEECSKCMVRLLSGQGFTVMRAPSGEAALAEIERAVAANAPPELIVICAYLPKMSAGQLVRRLRLDVATRSVPILMLTEDVSPRVEREGLESGADAYISRSAHPDLLVLRIRALLQSGSEVVAGEETAQLRRARIVIIHPPCEDEKAETPEEDYDHAKTERPSSLGELLWRDGHTVTSVERSPDLIEGGWVGGTDAPDCLVIEDIGRGRDDLEFCRLLEARREALLEAGGLPFRTLGIVEAERFRRESSGEFFEAGIDDLVPSDISMDVLVLRIRTLAQRRMAQDSFRRQEAERQQQALALETARAKAELAEALSQANRELAQTNARLLQTQAKLVHTAKMASLGELVAGIAHEINNPLAFTIGHADTVMRALQAIQEIPSPASAETGELTAKGMARLNSMKMGLQRIQDLVLRLRRFSRLDESAFQRVDVPDAVETALALLAHKLGKGVRVERDLRAPPHLICQAALINQAVMNIVSNAADALASVAEKPGYPEGRVVISSRMRDGYYDIVVADDGPGLPAELRSRVFEPFFTTKPVGEGTGLGLAIAHGVVEAHGGSIELTDACLPGGQGRGACFRLSIPVHETPDGLAARGRPS